MTKAILFITLALSTILWANTTTPTIIEKSIGAKRDVRSIHKSQQEKIKRKHYQTKQRDHKAEKKRHKKKMDKKLAHRKAIKRSFRTHDEFKNIKRHHTKRNHHKTNRQRTKYFREDKHTKNIKVLKRSSRHHNYNDEYYYDDHDINEHRDYRKNRHHRAHEYKHTRNSWYLAYRYERASFYDRYGYYYGYFNRHGYLFEGDFYRYDRYYTFRDRVRGKGLFDHRYYRPVMDNYYSNFDDPYYRR